MNTTIIIVSMVALHAQFKPRTTQIRSRNVNHLDSVYMSAQNASVVTNVMTSIVEINERRMLHFLLAPVQTKNYAPHSATVVCS